jgi:predicted secreted protein
MASEARSFSDNRSDQFVLVPFCVLSQAFHAEGLVKYDWRGVIKPIIQTLIDRDINIIQMPCMETQFYGGPETGLNRQPKGMKHYDVPEFRKFCRTEALKVVSQIKGIHSNGYSVVAILGMEYSPSCAVKVQYPPRKNQTNSGVYVQELTGLLEDEQLDIPVLGINRRGINPTIKRLEQLLDSVH